MRGLSACARELAVLTAACLCLLSSVGLVAAPRDVAAAPRDPGGPPPNATAAGFAQALGPRAFVFPHDHGPHPGFRQEWWYVTGNLDATSGERFGFELTFFRFALQPPAAPVAAAGGGVPVPAAGSSAWRTREIFMAHFAVTDVAHRRFRSMQKLSREALGLAGAEPSPLRVWVDDWSLAAAVDNPDTGEERWTLHAAQPGYEIELTLVPQGAPVLNGNAGLSRKSDAPADASYYYSIPRLAVRGRLLRGAATLDVHGLAWLDREWGSGALGANEAGWDWFGLQLDDGSALMFYALRDRDGRRDVHSAGTWIAANGATRSLSSTDVDIAVTDEWRNASGARYPAGWRIRSEVPALDLNVHPVLADQELQTTPRYWEGAVNVSGERAGRRISGRGYVELVGYASGSQSTAATGAPEYIVR
jgi:predicted secreted hydrolase